MYSDTSFGSVAVFLTVCPFFNGGRPEPFRRPPCLYVFMVAIFLKCNPSAFPVIVFCAVFFAFAPKNKLAPYNIYNRIQAAIYQITYGSARKPTDLF